MKNTLHILKKAGLESAQCIIHIMKDWGCFVAQSFILKYEIFFILTTFPKDKNSLAKFFDETKDGCHQTTYHCMTGYYSCSHPGVKKKKKKKKKQDLMQNKYQTLQYF